METIVKRFSELTTTELYEILKFRAEVFVVEQGCAYLDPDGVDKDACHVYIEDNGEIVAYLRVADKGKYMEEVSFSRVISKYRRKGLGTRLILDGIIVAEEKYSAKRIIVGAQKHAVPFYERVGFKSQENGEYIENGRPRVYMIREKE